jgi:nicotinamide-nucleotide amidase
MKATIITIGDEILHGQTIDTNSAWMATQLNDRGIEIGEIISVSDKKDHIIDGLNRALSMSSIVLITGGLGPTRDDITKHTLAQYFDSELIFNEEVFEDVQTLFHRRGLALLERNKLQAMVPAKCRVVRNANGTAPGMWFRTDAGQVVVSMPGVPLEMKGMMTDTVLPWLAETFDLPILEHRFLMTAGVGESRIAELLESEEDNLPPHISLAYLPSHGMVKLRLTARGEDRQQLKADLLHVQARFEGVLGNMIYGEGVHLTLEEVVGQLLAKHHLTLVTAESCTGGYIGHRITSIPGSSGWFAGGIISYSNDVKQQHLGVQSATLEQHGAVSEATVTEMLQGLLSRFPVQVGIAISGVAGPGGGTPDKPVGTVWVAYGMADDVRTKKLQLHTKRLLNIELSATLSLNLLRLYLMERFEKRG